MKFHTALAIMISLSLLHMLLLLASCHALLNVPASGRSYTSLEADRHAAAAKLIIPLY
jgi:hypothetical protein